MNTLKNKFQLFLLSTLLGATNAFAAIDISKAPLETGTTVDPNVMFILDDSGSMLQGLLPEDLDTKPNFIDLRTGGTTRSPIFPKIKYTGIDMEVFNMSKLSNVRFLASSHVNKNYYDPNVIYPIPLGPDGKSLGQSNFNSAWLDGYDLANRDKSSNASWNKINLGSNYFAIMSRSYKDITTFAGSTGAYRNNYVISPNGQAGQAFYYNYKSSCSKDIYHNDCYEIANPTTEAEKQNFANWFSYYRNRLMIAKAGISSAFHQQGSSMRVGYGTINGIKMTAIGSLFTSSDTKNIPVKPFDTENKAEFTKWLFNVHPDKTEYFTPLRAALDKVGIYYTTDAPWISSGTSNTKLECRQSYSILMTDGYYTDGENTNGISLSTIGNQDGTEGAELISSNGTKFKFLANTNPFADSVPDTLADVAMKYWKTDLQKDLPNSVPTSKLNPAFWQHMVTFGVGLGVLGDKDPVTAFKAIETKSSMAWVNPEVSKTNVTTPKIDDLLHAAVNSRGGFFSASDPISFAKGLAQTLNAISERVGSASNIAATSINSIRTQSNLYQARYVSGEWSGDLWSYDVSDTTTPIWKASEKMPVPEDRNIYFGSTTGSAKEFEWDNLTEDEKKWLGNDRAVLDYITGIQTLEKKNIGGKFRNRVKILGDLVNSSPELVAEPQDLNYQRLNIEGATSYRDFLNDQAQRAPMLYVGGNDGMLHGFDAKTGVEKFAYIPKNVMKPSGADSVNVLYKYAQPEYIHEFSVDGSPVAVDVYIDSKWQTILIGGLGRGSANHSGGVGSIGGGFYAIDVTNPGAHQVKWDKSFPEAGTFLGEPQVTLMNTGDWAVILGYGFNNSTNQSGILVINIANGNIIANISTNTGSSSDPNAMSELSLVDKNADGTTDIIYGGDLHGQVWKFDVSNTNANLWSIDYNGKPLFIAKDTMNKRQKITGGVMTTIEPKTGSVWVFFGTGQYLNQNDPSDASTQSWYGIKDGLQISGRSELVERIITNVDNYRTISDGVEITNKRGWYMDLPSARERIVDMPMMIGAELVMNTVIPDTNVCNPAGSGYIMAISPFTGQRLKRPFFDLNNDDQFNDSDKVTAGSTTLPPSGILVSSLNSVMTIVKEGEMIKTVNNCKDGCVESRSIDPTLNSGMQSWREITK